MDTIYSFLNLLKNKYGYVKVNGNLLFCYWGDTLLETVPALNFESIFTEGLVEESEIEGRYVLSEKGHDVLDTNKLRIQYED